MKSVDVRITLLFGGKFSTFWNNGVKDFVMTPKNIKISKK